MFLSRGDRDLGVAFQTHPGRQAFISSGSKDTIYASHFKKKKKLAKNVLKKQAKIQILFLTLVS